MEQYSEDIDEALYNELIHLHNYIKLTCKSEDLPISHLSLYKIIKEEKKEIGFPNSETILRIYLCLMLTNCYGEPSFSKLRLTKNDLRSTMIQNTLNSFSLLSSNVDLMKKIDFDELIEEFAKEKCRKKLM